MISVIRFEVARIFSKPYIIAFMLLLIASLYFTSLGISENRYLMEEEKAFTAGEAAKSEMYMTYEQYGVAGIRVMLEPSALAVFFNRNDFVKNIEAVIDTSEVVKVFSKRKGRKAFTAAGRFGDLNQIISIFGTLIMVMMGFRTFPNKHTFAFFSRADCIKTVISWLLILDVLFSLVLVINYGFAGIMELSFTSAETAIFFYYALIALLTLNLFYILGLVAKTLLNTKKSAIPALLTAWFVLVFVFPETGKLLTTNSVNKLPSVEILDQEKMQVLLDAEREGREHIGNVLKQNHDIDEKELKGIAKDLFENYLKNGYITNKKKEKEFLEQVKQTIDSAAGRALLSPVDFLNIVAGEASGKGYTAYLNFLEYVSRLKDDFIHYYGKKRYASGEEQSISFIRDTENIYRSKAGIPKRMPLGIAVTFFCIVVLFFVWVNTIRRKKITTSPPLLPGNIRRNYMLFLLANKEKQETLFNSLAKEYPCTLDMCSHEVINGEVTASSFTRFACRLKGVNGDRVANYLERLKFKETARLKLARYPEEERKKLICAIVFAAENAEAIVINDFLKGVSHEFERTFLEMAAEEAASGRRLIYVSSRMYAPASSLIKQDVIVEEHQPFQLELQKISLR